MKKLAFLTVLVLVLSLFLPACGGENADTDAAAESTGAQDAADQVPATLTVTTFDQWLGSGKKVQNSETKNYTFTLGEDITLPQEITLDGRSVTLELNGHTISGGQIRAFTLTNGATLTLRGGKLETKGADADGGVIRLTDSDLILDQMTVSNTDDSHISERRTGGVIYANSENTDFGKITLQGGTQINGSPSGLRRNGGAITLAGNASMTVKDATVQNGKAGTGGNILMDNNATVRLLKGATVQGGHAVHNSETSGYGGNITGYALSQLHLQGGIITSGRSDKAGGNVYLSNTAGEQSGMHIYSGSVENGTADTNGGNIFAAETFSLVRIYGGTVQGGIASLGSNISLQSAKLQLWDGLLLGCELENQANSGGNIYAETSDVFILGGTVKNGHAQNYGGNIYVTGSNLNIYGGTIADGATSGKDTSRGGGNVYAGGNSTVNLYGGVIEGGVANCEKDQENTAAGANVMIGGNTFMQMFDGVIRNGMVYGSTTRGGGVYVYGQAKRTSPVFHMYGGIIENGELENTMRGMCVASYSESNGDTGIARTRIFGGEIRYTGPDDANKVNAIYGNKTKGTDLYIFQPENYEGIYRRVTAEPCPDESHNTPAEGLIATCLTPGAEGFACATCGQWYKITESPIGHTLTDETTNYGTAHRCTACDAHWYDPQ